MLRYTSYRTRGKPSKRPGCRSSCFGRSEHPSRDYCVGDSRRTSTPSPVLRRLRARWPRRHVALPARPRSSGRRRRATSSPRPIAGHEGVRRYLGTVADEFDDLRIEPLELIDAGDQVVVSVRISGRGERVVRPLTSRSYRSHRFATAKSFELATIRRRPKPSKPPGCRSRRCRRRTWRSCARLSRRLTRGELDALVGAY